jgi:hypothetical protein
VVVSGRATEAPRVLGFVATSQRRSIFVSASRIASLDNSGARLKSWDVDLNPFRARDGERLLGREILDQKIGDETVSDVALAFQSGRNPGWHITKVRLAKLHWLQKLLVCATCTQAMLLLSFAHCHLNSVDLLPLQWTTSVWLTYLKNCQKTNSCA